MTTRARLDFSRGISAYLEDLQKVGVDIDAAAQGALSKGAEILHAEMDRLVPKETGNLQEHIVILGPFQDGNVSYVEVGVVGADAETAIYGNVQEYGSPSKNIKPQSYIRAAIDNKAAAVKKAIRESLKAAGFVS
jgi:HK97 gp10 family phage protein